MGLPNIPWQQATPERQGSGQSQNYVKTQSLGSTRGRHFTVIRLHDHFDTMCVDWYKPK